MGRSTVFTAVSSVGPLAEAVKVLDLAPLGIPRSASSPSAPSGPGRSSVGGGKPMTLRSCSNSVEAKKSLIIINHDS